MPSKHDPPRVASTSLFRLLNPELFVRPVGFTYTHIFIAFKNKPVMIFGLASFAFCATYLAVDYFSTKPSSTETALIPKSKSNWD